MEYSFAEQKIVIILVGGNLSQQIHSVAASGFILGISNLSIILMVAVEELPFLNRCESNHVFRSSVDSRNLVSRIQGVAVTRGQLFRSYSYQFTEALLVVIYTPITEDAADTERELMILHTSHAARCRTWSQRARRYIGLKKLFPGFVECLRIRVWMKGCTWAYCSRGCGCCRKERTAHRR